MGDGPFDAFRRSFMFGIFDKSKISEVLQERVERQSGLKVHELQSFPFLHRLPILPNFIKYSLTTKRSLILPFVAEILNSEENSQNSEFSLINLDQIGLCDQDYFRLNRCVIEGLAKDNKDENNPKFSRLSKCKHHFIIYDKCVTKRDRMIDKQILKHELSHLTSLNEKEKNEYFKGVENLISEYFSQMVSSKEQTEKFALGRKIKLIEERLNKLKKSLE
ncbi:hypothetical protein TpMuguga_02g02425 [Theileria parva strain Muguga]|uniref:uncharacterized protein n=1 Tax=Theileria parva strain Muguga TaxID=333668 RepID=UPI001C61F327|nr:uncharacterized protein TpMuguga_02g02425 [Theileria parva strain Muguga]KAF5153652.1 hypothetical protein TpMuguga_02g02425 [Theileria parva strain Muguga]